MHRQSPGDEGFGLGVPDRLAGAEMKEGTLRTTCFCSPGRVDNINEISNVIYHSDLSFYQALARLQ